MLLNQFKTGSSAATLRGTRDGFLLGQARSLGRPKSLQVRASSSSAEGAGWLDSASSKIGKMGSYVEKKMSGSSTDGASDNMVVYTGTAVIMKKLKVLDVMDRVADAQDDASELFRGKKISVQLMSNEIDSSTGKPMVGSDVNIDGWVKIFDPVMASNVSFNMEFPVPKTFGAPVAITVKNNHPNEFLLVSFTLDLPDKSQANFMTNSWIYNTEKTEPRVFFRNKAYLPSETPASLKDLREKELKDLRGDGIGERIESDRIYDFDVYNDLGKPDDDPKHERPTLGGTKEFPFPRRMRTGRPTTKFNPAYESRTTNIYVPSDERFDVIKLSDNTADMVRAGGHAVSSKIVSKLSKKTSFESVDEVMKLYAANGEEVDGINNVLPGKVDVDVRDQNPMVFLAELTAKRNDNDKNSLLRFPLPKLLQVDANAWRQNTEFARQYVAGCNPIEIQCVQEFPIKSKLSPAEYGDPTSAISANHIEGKLEGLSVEQAVSQKKLFVVDYHDLFLPWVGRVNAMENSKMYASRVLLFNSSEGTLNPLAIELVLPPKTHGGEKTAKVITPSSDTSKPDHLFDLARAHAINNEMTMHQAINHFTRCHAVVEPMIIATHRNLSKLHPIHQLLFPHCRHTLLVNSTARKNLLPAEGTIEQIYTPRQYVVRMASAFYKDYWTFHDNALPVDLIRRGMAVPDSSAKHGVNLILEDYPYAADGLEVWGAMKEWNKEYIDIFYADDSVILKDVELQNWYGEYRNIGHGDKKDAAGWLELNSKENLVEILTTMQWISTAMHAPINFGQFDYSAFMPMKPGITRRLIPDEGTKEWQQFQANPIKFFMETVSDTDTTTTAMAVFEVVAAHAPNEEYIDERKPDWTDNDEAKAAFKRYSDKLQDIDQLIQYRNNDKNLKNRCGPAQFPFQLLRPHSTPGVTARGIPNSITV